MNASMNPAADLFPNEAPRASRRGGWSMPLHVLMGGLVVASMLILAALLMWEGWHTSREALLAASRENARDIGALINEKILRTLEPPQAMLAQLALDPLARAGTLDDRLARLPSLAQVLDQSALVSTVYVGYPNGEFLMARRLDNPYLVGAFGAPAQARYMVQSITLDAGGRPVGRWHFYDARLQPLGSHVQPDYQFDPRSRPWYSQAMETGTVQLTDPYVFYSLRQPGMTLSLHARDADAVLGVDVTLADLSREVAVLRHTPRTEIAVVDRNQEVVAYSNLDHPLVRGTNDVRLQGLDALPVAALQTLQSTPAAPREEVSYRSGGELWHGLDVPLAPLPGSALHVLIAIPDRDLLGPMREVLARQGWWTLLLVLVLLPLGWLAGYQVSRSLSFLARRAQQLTRFDFDTSPSRPSLVREIKDLDAVFGNMCLTIQNFLRTTDMISREQRLDLMLEGVLQKLVESAQCQAGAVYLFDRDCDSLTLEAACAAAGQRRIALPGRMGLERIDELEGRPDQLALRLTGRHDETLGLLVLRHELDDRHQGQDFRAFAVNLSGALAVSIETRNLLDSQQRLFHAVIQLLADAIDAKSPYTSGHCERVPELAEMLVDRLCAERDGRYADFHMSETERYEFRVGAWLHDCGKVTSPEHIIDKATKLETIYNRIHEIRTRFEVLWRDATIAHLERLARGASVQESLDILHQRQRELQDDFAFVAGSNIGSESMTRAAIDRLHAIGTQTWVRHFDDRLGLSQDELKRHAGRPPAALPVQEPLLADRAEHVVPWGPRKPPVERGDPANRWGFDMHLPANAQNMGELHNLSIERGTLTSEDRFRINDHIVQTYVLLSSLPWPDHLARVPEIAATHHERLDGRGYPRALDAERLSVADRVMALADVFEALTAADRPYKAPKTLTEALQIMARMTLENHLDAELFRYFLRSRLWQDFAAAHMRPEQIDQVDEARIMAMFDEGSTSSALA